MRLRLVLAIVAALAAACSSASGSKDAVSPADVPDGVDATVPVDAQEGVTDPGTVDPGPGGDLPDTAVPDPGTDVPPADADPDAVDPGAPDGDDVPPGDVDPDAAPGDATGETDVPSPKKVPMYDESVVVEFRLDFAPADWNTFLTYWKTGNKSEVHCSFTFGDKSFPDAACQPKGNPLYWKDEKKPQFTVKFNKWDNTGRFNGLRRVHLENSPFHPAPIRDRLGMWVMREAGLDASRVNHAKVLVNGEYFGLYQNIEVLDREFLEDHYADPGGNLYEEGYILKTNEDVNDTSDLDALDDLIANEPLEGDHAAFYAELEKRMNIHQVLREMAAEIVLPTPDNFTNGSSNFYYYHDPATGFVVLPWDLDDILGEFAPFDVDVWEYWGGTIGNPPSRLRLLVNQNPAWRQELIQDIAEIRDGPYAQLADRTAQVCAQIRDLVDQDPGKRAPLEDFDADCAAVKKAIGDRIVYLKKSLGR